MMAGAGAIVLGLSAAALAGSNVPARWIVLVLLGLLAGIAGVIVAVAALVGMRRERGQTAPVERGQGSAAAPVYEPSVPRPVRIGLIVSIALFVVIVIAVVAFFIFITWALKDFSLL